VKVFLLAAAMAVFLISPLPAQGAGRTVLVVYRLESERQSITKVLSTCGYDVYAIAEEKYRNDFIAGCTAIATFIRQPYVDALDAGIPVLCVGPQVLPIDGIQVQTAHGLSGLLHIGNISSSIHLEEQSLLIQEYEGIAVGEMVFPLRGSFPYGVIHDSVAYVPNFNQDEIQPLALGLVVRQLLGGPDTGRLFLLIDEVYPFSDLGMLCHMADDLYAHGYPFTVSAMPVYDNLEYPAYRLYTQVLRYAQSRGGAIVMHDPIIRSAESKMESTDARLDRASAAFEQQGIVLANGIVSPYPVTLAGFAGLHSAEAAFGPLPMDISVTLPIAKTPEEFKQTIQLVSKKWIAVSSLLKMVTDDPFIYNEQPVSGGYAYREEIQTSFEGFFSAGNQTLVVVVLISLAIFAGLLAGSYFLYRHKFYR